MKSIACTCNLAVLKYFYELRGMRVLMLLFLTFIFIDGMSQCTEKELGLVRFKKNSVKLTEASRKTLDNIVAILKTAPNCSIAALGVNESCGGKFGKLTWDRVGAAFNYLESKGIDRNRFIYTFYDGEDDTVVRLAMSPPLDTNALAPHPNLRRRG